MDLLVIARKIWLYRVATLPIIVLTLLAALYVVVIKDAEYEATSNYILINPPPPPGAEDIAANPALADINSDNPFTRFRPIGGQRPSGEPPQRRVNSSGPVGAGC